VVKNKIAPPFREAEFDIIYGQGISREGNVLDLGEANDIITRSGTWYSYGDVKLGQGRENAREFLRDNPDLAAEIESKIRHLAGLKLPQPSATSQAEGETS